MMSSENPGKGPSRGALSVRAAASRMGPVLPFSGRESWKTGFSDLQSLLPTNDNVLQ